MRILANSVEEYLAQIPEERKNILTKLRQILSKNLPDGFQEEMQYGMPSFVVPKSIYPLGYHVNPNLSLPFIALASQKNHIGFYHMGLYAHPPLLNWFTRRYHRVCDHKLDMGKSCIRLKKMEQIPYLLLEDLASKMTPKAWISVYEKQLKP